MVTIVFATHNGSRTLPRMLSSLEQLRYPRDDMQIIAVDNASTDKTAEILDSFRRKLPLTVLEERKRGKNRALNMAIPHIAGDLVVFTDDDVIAQPDWIDALKNCASSCKDYDVFGGAIRPFWESPPPDWALASVPLAVSFGLTGDEHREGPISPARVWGGNMMVRGRVFKAGHRFNERVGPESGQYIMGSETEFNVRLGADGFKAWFCPEAVVQHIIRSHQLDRSWILKRAFRWGRSMRYQEFMQNTKPADPWLFGQVASPRWMVRAALKHALYGGANLVRGRTSQAMSQLWDCYLLAGYMRQAQLMRDGGGPQRYGADRPPSAQGPSGG